MDSQLTIHIIGLGVQQEAVLDSKAQTALLNADCIMGSDRQLEVVSRFAADAQICTLPSLKDLPQTLVELEDTGVQSLVVLASGDPLYFGIGRWFRQRFEFEKLRFYPAVSSIQAACHVLGLSLQDVTVVSLHGRPLTNLRRYLQPNRSLILLTDKNSSPQAIAEECVLAELDQSRITVCENLGYDTERINTFEASSLAHSLLDFSALNVVVLETSSQVSYYPSAVGFQDTLFVTDKEEGKGMITKRDIRVAILSYMQIDPQDIVWDIGAGCGGVSVEMSYWHDTAEVYAIEHHNERLACLQANKTRFGVSNMTIVPVSAPEGLFELPNPNKVFVGGSDGRLSEVLSTVWQRLPLGGILVATSVTEASKRTLLDFTELVTADENPVAEFVSVQLSLAKDDLLANQRVYRPALPVTLFQFRKR